MSWQRKWFFWMESLQITAGERRIMMLLLVTGMITTGVAQFGPSRTIYDQQYYEPVIAEFKRLTEARESEQAELMARYYPPEEYSPLTVLKMKRIPEDAPLIRPTDVMRELSTDSAREQSADQLRDRNRISGSSGSLAETVETNDLQVDRGGSESDREQSCKKASGSYGEQDRKLVRMRTAGKDDLMTLPGIGPVTAERILVYREENGPIQNLDDLMNVSGIGPVTIENIRDYIIFD